MQLLLGKLQREPGLIMTSRRGVKGMFADFQEFRLIPTDLMSKEQKALLVMSGLPLALFEDAVKAVLKIATDTSVNGKLATSPFCGLKANIEDREILGCGSQRNRARGVSGS